MNPKPNVNKAYSMLLKVETRINTCVVVPKSLEHTFGMLVKTYEVLMF